MPKITNLNSGIYLLEIIATANFSLTNDAFRGQFFLKGYYYYAGSAQKNLSSRLERHLSKAKKLHWHIDYITSRKDCRIKSIIVFGNEPKSFECELAKTLQSDFNLKIAAAGFGNGDCSLCVSHLLYSKKKINYSHFISRYQSAVRLIPSSIETV